MISHKYVQSLCDIQKKCQFNVKPNLFLTHTYTQRSVKVSGFYSKPNGICGLYLDSHLNKPKVKSIFKTTERKNKLKLVSSVGLGTFIYYYLSVQYCHGHV